MTMATAGAGEGGSPPDQPAASRSQQLQQEYPRPASAAAARTAAASARAAAVNTVSELPLAHNSYVELSRIGNGAYGTVFLGRDRHNDGRLVALKKIRITLSDDGVPVNALREIVLLKQLEKFDHPNIVRLLDVCIGHIESVSRLTLILVFEYVEQDLDHFLKHSPSPSLEPSTIKSLMHQVLCGVDFLHQNRIIHRDLKPQNLLVDRFHRIKIADFGVARIYDFHMRLTTMVVTLWYRAPEVLLSNTYATPVDMWACGCIFAELFRRKPLFEGQTEGDQLQRIFDVIGKPSESEWPKDVSLSLNNFRDNSGRPLQDVVPEITPDAVDLLQKLLLFVPSNRLSANDALQHPYFKGLTTPKVGVSAASASVPASRSSPTPQARPTSTAAASRSSPTPPPPSASPPFDSSLNTSTATSHDSSNISLSSSDTSSSCSSSFKQASANDENNPNAGNNKKTISANNNNNGSNSDNNNSSESASGSSEEAKMAQRSEACPSGSAAASAASMPLVARGGLHPLP